MSTSIDPGASRHYLDHASTSPTRPEVVAAMTDVMAQRPGDPSRIHQEGMRARVAVEDAREQVAALLGARGREVVFTSGATEAIVTAVWGATERGHHILVPAVEHSAVRAASEMLCGSVGGEVTVVGVDEHGRLDPDAIVASIRPETALVHAQWGNHEVGTIQPVIEVVERCHEHGVLVHVDAAAAVGHVPVDFHEVGADLLSVSAHKFGGPPGIGALLVRRGLRLRPLLVGGDQERARRAGLENLPAIVGFAAACTGLGDGVLALEQATARAQTDRVLDAVPTWDGVRIYGDPTERLPHLVCLGIDGIEPQAVLLGLDQAGIAAHSGSACSSEALEPSPVLEAMGVDAHRSLRISVGWNTSDTDIDALLAAVPSVIEGLRSLRPSAS